MRNLITFIALAIFVNTQLTAQQINFGAKAGVNFATIAGEDASGFNGRTSFHAGFLAEIPIASKFSLQPEIQYSDQGATAKGAIYTTDGLADFEAKVKLGYLNLPILANYQVTEAFSFQGGPQIGYLLSAKTEVDVSLGVESGTGEDDAKDQLKAFDLGLAFGAEYEFSNGFFISARYVIGLTNMMKAVDTISIGTVEEDPDFAPVSYQPKTHNNVGQVSVGYMF